MTDLGDNLAWIVGSIATAIAMAIGWFISSGVVINLLFLLIGAGITYFAQTRTQKRAWKRENSLTMRDKVYGPIFREVSMILENLELCEKVELDATRKLEDEMRNYNYLFYKIPHDLKEKLYELVSRLENYTKIRYGAETKILEIIREAVIQAYKVDVNVRQSAVVLRMEIEYLDVATMSLEQALIQRITPKEFVERVTKEFGDNVAAKLSIGGSKRAFDDFAKLYEIVMKKLENEPLYLEELKQRKALIRQSTAFLEQIKVFIDLD
jgi:hypothetical protein